VNASANAYIKLLLNTQHHKVLCIKIKYKILLQY